MAAKTIFFTVFQPTRSKSCAAERFFIFIQSAHVIPVIVSDKYRFCLQSVLFDKIDHLCLEIESRKVEQVALFSEDPMHRIIWKFKTYEQFSLYRVADLAATIFDCCMSLRLA